MAVPFVLKAVADDWPAMKWTPEIIAEALATKRVRIRLGFKKHRPGEVLWETDSVYVDATMKQLLVWRGGEDDGTEDSPFRGYSADEYWAYVDYKYMFELFGDPGGSGRLGEVDWGVVGLDRDGLDSTFWMGTRGAYTPCHYDTYGFNLVAQLYGRKRWLLFPPEDDLLPTRLPYEESSVFSSLDFLLIDVASLSRCHPRMVELAEGDVLFVPPKWWHFVQCLSDVTISVNTWVDTPAYDRVARPVEALTRVIMAMTVSGRDTTRLIVQDPNGAVEPAELDAGLDVLNAVIEDDKGEVENKELNQFLRRWRSDGEEVGLIDIEELKRYMDENRVVDIEDTRCRTGPTGTKKKLDRVDVLRAIMQPDVVQLICDRLKSTIVKK